jgi:hypothetical protein
MDQLNEINLFEYLKKHYPHLYDFQMEIQKVVNATGFGEATISCTIRQSKVFTADLNHWIKHLYAEKEEKKLD